MATAETKDKILNWFINGETGNSSKAMAAVFAGHKPKRANSNYPSDPSDFNRCLMLLEAVPEGREELDKLKKLSPEWKALVESWKKVEDTFLEEVGFDWSKGSHAPRTFALMKALYKGESLDFLDKKTEPVAGKPKF